MLERNLIILEPARRPGLVGNRARRGLIDPAEELPKKDCQLIQDQTRDPRDKDGEGHQDGDNNA